MSTASLVVLTEDRTERAASWAVRLADGHPAPEMQDDFQAWLDEDPLNGEVFEEIVGAWRTLDHYAGSAQMITLREDALSSARRTLRQREQGLWPTAVVRVLVVATLLVAVGAGLWAWRQPQNYQTGIGERRMVTLRDGSRLSLDADTLVKVSYSSEGRRLWLDRGRAKFEVAKDALRPFSVAAGNEVVVATGTEFSVEKVGQQVRVVLYEGHVALLRRAKDDGRSTEPMRIGAVPAERLLTPGRELVTLEPAAGATMAPATASPDQAAFVAAVDARQSLSWETGMLAFEDERLGVVVDRMNRYASKPLAVSDPTTANLRISGVFKAGDTEALVEGLQSAFGVHAQVSADKTALFLGKSAHIAS